MAIPLPSLQPPTADRVADRRLRLLTARGGAEVASMGAAIGSIYVADQLTPNQMQGLKSFMARRVIAPHIDSFDWMADKMPGFEGTEGVALRHNMSTEDKAKYFAEGLVDYSLMAGGAMVAQTGVQWLLDHMLGLHLSGSALEQGKKMAIATGVDRGMHLGSVLLLTTAMPDASEKLQKSIANNVMKRMGVKDDHTAESNARYLVTWQLPNLVGWAGSLGFLDKVYAGEARARTHL